MDTLGNVLVLHGTNSNPQDNWFPWLETELKERNYTVWMPNLPRADKPNIKRYNDFIFSRWKFDDHSIIVGHSSGAVAILGILQGLPQDIVIKRVILVAGFINDLGWEPLRELFLTPFYWKRIRQRAKEIILIHSDNDPYVPLWHGEKLRDLLHAKLIVLSNQGHFNLEKGPEYRQFPFLLEKIVA